MDTKIILVRGMWVNLVLPIVLNFSLRLGQECQPFRWDAPTSALFDPENILIMSNGR